MNKTIYVKSTDMWNAYAFLANDLRLSMSEFIDKSMNYYACNAVKLNREDGHWYPVQREAK